MTDLVILGAGAHARVLESILRHCGRSVCGCIAAIAPDEAWPANIAYLGSDEVLESIDPNKVRLVNGVGGVAPNEKRANLFERGRALGFSFETIIDPRAIVADDVVVGEGSQLLMGAILQSKTSVGMNCIINIGAVIDHDCVIEDHVHIAPGVSISGKVKIGAGAHIGTGASIIQNITIGNGVLLAAGCVVVKDVPPSAVVAGVPARRLR